MKIRACVLHGKGDVRIDTREVGNVGPKQVRVRVGAGGICGSDIHYFWDGGIGTIQVSEPIILGHEVAGTVEAVGGEVANVKPGDRVALCPSLPCGHCRFCQIGQQQHCLEMQFFGSAMRKPHCNGGFRDEIIVEDFQCEPVGNIGLDEAACAEPLSVGLHAINNAAGVFGKRVLVMGAGPIGALLVGAAKLAGAQEIVAVDLADAPLAAAVKMGANSTVNARTEPDRLASLYSADKGYFDAGFECTGVDIALGNMFPVVKPRGTIVAVRQQRSPRSLQRPGRQGDTPRRHASLSCRISDRGADDRGATRRCASDHHDAADGPYSRRFRPRARSLIADEGATDFRDVERRDRNQNGRNNEYDDYDGQ